ncbi:hypothetical protein BC834DRAFT_1045407 [Gloeopeniophorella convolvens]|nr:hypothetical protein BC834DRAFT_1045407 [Gloeopeniophorella convolvens]
MQAITIQQYKDRYAILQRKLEQLEKVHAEGKKQYQTTLDNLTGELTTVRKANADQSTRIEKLKKQADAQDARVQELKKTVLTDQADLKDLRAKLRSAEAERTALQAKHDDAVRTKHAARAADTLRRDELRERDQRVAELEAALAAEKRKRAEAEAKLRDATEQRADEETQRALDGARTRTQLEQARAETAQTKAALDAARAQGGEEREALVAQVEALRDVLAQAAEAYGRLVAETVGRAAHGRLRREYDALQFRTLRLERKLANSDAQVKELATLVRQTRDANVFLEAQLRAAHEDSALYASALEDLRQDLEDPRDSSTHILLSDTLFTLHQELLDTELDIREALSSGDQQMAKLLVGLNQELVTSCVSTRADLDAEALARQTTAVQLQTANALQDATAADLHATRAELESSRRRLEETSNTLGAARASEAALAEEIKVAKSQNREQAAAHKQALQREKDASGKLVSSLQQSKVAEEELRGEIDQLATELADAERYREAYHTLVDEVGILAARNELAEGEANRLSRFNAEILGHTNPAQRIVYLDRVRRELAETKQTLVVVTRERDAAGAQIEGLRRELGLYRSVPVEGKPRTHMTRVARVPFAAQSQNVDPARTRSASAEVARHLPPLADGSGDMSVDEIL